MSGILAYEWGICAALSGTLWIGASEHLFNNFISNSLHTVTETGAASFLEAYPEVQAVFVTTDGEVLYSNMSGN